MLQCHWLAHYHIFRRRKEHHLSYIITKGLSFIINFLFIANAVQLLTQQTGVGLHSHDVNIVSSLYYAYIRTSSSHISLRQGQLVSSVRFYVLPFRTLRWFDEWFTLQVCRGERTRWVCPRTLWVKQVKSKCPYLMSYIVISYTFQASQTQLSILIRIAIEQYAKPT